MELNPSQHPVRHTARRPRSRLRWHHRNLLLLIPVMTLLTPLYNRIEPRLFGIPFFYWFQLAFLLGTIFLMALFVRLTEDDEPAVEFHEVRHSPNGSHVPQLPATREPPDAEMPIKVRPRIDRFDGGNWR